MALRGRTCWPVEDCVVSQALQPWVPAVPAEDSCLTPGWTTPECRPSNDPQCWSDPELPGGLPEVVPSHIPPVFSLCPSLPSASFKEVDPWWTSFTPSWHHLLENPTFDTHYEELENWPENVCLKIRRRGWEELGEEHWYKCVSVLSGAKTCPILCDPKQPSLPVLHYLPGFAQIHVRWVSDAI